MLHTVLRYRHPLLRRVKPAITTTTTATTTTPLRTAYTDAPKTLPKWEATPVEKHPPSQRAGWPAASFDVPAMTHLLDHDNHEMRKELREFLSDPLFSPKYNISLEEEREVGIHIFCSITSAHPLLGGREYFI